MKELICPKCGHTIEWWDTVDDSSDVDTHELLCIGGCPHCETEYRWWEIYKFSHIVNLEEEVK